MKGGVGKTSTTANLAAALAPKFGAARVLALDLDPQNSLQLHFSLGAAPQQGVCRQSLHERDWSDIAFASKFGGTCLPYGVVSEVERIAFETLRNNAFTLWPDLKPCWISGPIGSACNWRAPVSVPATWS